MHESKKALRVDVISDTVCPWCFIGKRRLERAIAARADRCEVEVRFHPFQLDPGLPPEGEDARAYYARRFGSWERFRELTRHVAAVGAAEGIAFDFEKARRAPNTRASHRLVWLAGGSGRELEVVERLFAAHFVEGRDVGDLDTLAAIAAEAGLDAGEIRAALAGGAGEAEVAAAQEQFRRLGVSAVPFFVVEGKWAVSGAQPPEVFVELFDRAAAAAAEHEAEAENEDSAHRR